MTLQVAQSQERLYSELIDFGTTKTIKLYLPWWNGLLLSPHFFLESKERLKYSLMYWISYNSLFLFHIYLVSWILRFVCPLFLYMALKALWKPWHYQFETAVRIIQVFTTSVLIVIFFRRLSWGTAYKPVRILHFCITEEFSWSADCLKLREFSGKGSLHASSLPALRPRLWLRGRGTVKAALGPRGGLPLSQTGEWGDRQNGGHHLSFVDGPGFVLSILFSSFYPCSPKQITW